MLPTKADEQLCPYVNDVLLSVDRMRCFENELAEYKGDLRLGIGETLLCYRMPDILKSFHRNAPNAKLFLRSMNCYDIRDELLKGSLDLGIFYENVGGFGNDITAVPFGKYALSLVSSPETKQSFPDFITPNQKISVPLIINEQNCIFRQIFERYLQQKSILLDHTIELWSIHTIKSLVKNNVGITFLPTFTVQDEINNGELTEIETDISDVQLSAVCGYNKNKWLSPAMEHFVKPINNYSQRPRCK